MNDKVSDFQVPPVVKRIAIALPLEAAFARFVGGIGDWWPMQTYSLSGEDAEAVVIEPRLDGRLFERDRSGKEHEWGRITRWDPPRRLAFSWHVGRDEAAAQLVELSFVPEGEGRTRVELVHSGWEALGNEAAAFRHRYDGGWDGVLQSYVAGRSEE